MNSSSSESRTTNVDNDAKMMTTGTTNISTHSNIYDDHEKDQSRCVPPADDWEIVTISPTGTRTLRPIYRENATEAQTDSTTTIDVPETIYRTLQSIREQERDGQFSMWDHQKLLQVCAPASKKQW